MAKKWLIFPYSGTDFSHVILYLRLFFQFSKRSLTNKKPFFKHTSTVGCVWNFQNGGGCKLAIFQFSKLKFYMVPYFGPINCPTVAKIFSCKNGFLSLICIKLKRDTALKTISLDLPDNSTPL